MNDSKVLTDTLPWSLEERKVACGSCSACCHQLVLLTNDDIKELYETEEVAGLLFLRRTESGSCIYLKDNGCSIHNYRPMVCKAFDCGLWYKTTTRQQRKFTFRNGDTHDRQMLREGKKRTGESNG